MKTADKVPVSPMPSPTASHEEEAGNPLGKSLNLMPEQLEAAASAKTEVLAEILELAERSSRRSHWGINE